jgi:MFS family permease
MPNPLLDISSVEKDVTAPSPRIRHSKQKALERSINEGAAASFSQSLINTFMIPFALILKANAFQIGLLSSLAGLVSPISQIFGSRLMETRSRKKIVMAFVLLQALTLIPIAGLSFLAWKGVFPLALPYILVALFTLSVAFGGFAFPAWFSWMGDLVPPKDKGRYFSVRNRAAGIVGMAAVLIGSFALDAFKTKGLALFGFSLIFFTAFLFRTLSYAFFKKQYSPSLELKKDYYFSFWSFLKRYDNFGKYSVYKFFFYFSLSIASPFFAVYMLQDLQFSYVTFTLVSLSGGAFYLLMTPLAGKFSDRFGNVKLFYIGNLAFALTPLIWIFLTKPISLIFIPQFLAGLGNAALVLSFTNFTYDAVSQQKRGICAAYSNLLVGLGIFAGSLIGGAIIKFAPITFMNPILFIFLISAILRFLSGAIFIPQIKDERKVKKLPPLKEIKFTQPLRTVKEEIGWVKTVFK